jgi:hypothetical protein
LPPEVLSGEAAVGDVLSVAPADEVDQTLVVSEGVQTSVVASIDQPGLQRVTFDLDLAAGYTLVLNPDGSGLVFDEQMLTEVQAAGEQVPSGQTVDLGVAVAATLEAPWAVDAAGKELPTSYELVGDDLVQHVDTTRAVFPVAADPSFGLGWQGVIPVYYLHMTKSETYNIATYRIPNPSWICEFTPTGFGGICETLTRNRATDFVANAQYGVRTGRCLSMWQGYGPAISYLFYDAYTRSC